MKRLLLLALVACASPAFAWESICYQYENPTAEPAALINGVACKPDAGPNTARQRWVGPLDEHRVLWELTRAKAGLPESVSHTVSLDVFTDGSSVMLGETSAPTLVPSPFALTQRKATRAFTVGELAQLPDFSYALWDWALGNETCPLGVVGLTAQECHDFATHMGPVNSNHFLPQAGAFYARYHALAMAKAKECRALKDTLSPGDQARFGEYLRACEIEALALEAVGQHYLQDAWSSGHMWERWGAPDLSGFPGATAEDQRQGAVLIALVSGLIHGSRGVLQRLPAWTSYDVNDAMCAPNDAVQFIAADGAKGHGVGDDFLPQLAAHTLQSERFYSCAASGMRDVYEASGQLHGALGPGEGGWLRVDPTGAQCFGQRATNQAMFKGMGIQLKVAGQQINLPLDGKTVGWIVPKVAQSNGAVEVDPVLKARFRLQLIRMVSVSAIVAHDAPDGTALATGRLGTFLGATPNGAHLEDASKPLATYLEPALPWPNPSGAEATEQARALGLARLFHRAHVADWCRSTTADSLMELKAHAADPTLDADAKVAACEACAELTIRHLRVGDQIAWDSTREPICVALDATAPVVYQPGTSADSAASLARAWCGCP